MNNLYSVVDRKSGCAEYFIASCDEDAFRIFSVMAMSSRPMYEYLEDYELQRVRQLPDIRKVNDAIVLDGKELRRQLDSRRKESEESAKA